MLVMSKKPLKISIIIPCHNEEKSIRNCVQSCFNQTRKFDEIIVINDGSTDRSGEILKQFGNQIKVITIAVATGNKSYAQERGIKYVKGDVFVATDGDTILDTHFVEAIEKDFQDPRVMAVGGYVRSLKHNWLTACRELDYIIGQDIHKVAQAEMDFLFVIPGCAGAFRTSIFKEHIQFDHDTLTEDLDFTYRLHENKMKIIYDKKAISYTQDPATLKGYINQMRRWYAGGWQNLLKHYKIANRPLNALELSLMYIEGVIFSLLLFLFPILNINFFKFFILPYFIFQLIIGVYSSIVRKRFDLLFYAPLYIILNFVNAYVFLEQFFIEIIIRKKNLVWFQPVRREMASADTPAKL